MHMGRKKGILGKRSGELSPPGFGHILKSCLGWKRDFLGKRTGRPYIHRP
jgi:hypothetical protein